MDHSLNEKHSEDQEWVVVDEVAGSLKAEVLRGLLEAQGLTVSVSMEGLGHAYAFTVGPLANNQILVPGNQVELAQKVLQDYYAGAYELVEMEDIESSDDIETSDAADLDVGENTDVEDELPEE